jgi:hypothetical protein
MLYFPNTRIESSVERAVASGVTIQAEGIALVADYTGGVFGVKPSTGGAGDKFVGVAFNRPIDLFSVARIDSGVVPVGLTLLVGQPIMAGTLRVVNASTNAALTVVPGAPAAGEVQIDPGNPAQLNFNAAQAGITARATYRFAPTVAQSVAMQGMQDPGGPAGHYLGQIGVVRAGDVFTDQFDTTADWNSGTIDLKLGANGLFTNGGAGVSVPGYVLAVPSEGSATLGIHINAD